MGANNVHDIIIEGQETQGLIDTGAMVSTITVNFWEQLEPRPELHDVSELLRVDAANGQRIPYLGYIEAEVTMPFMMDSPMQIPLLVVPATEYNVKVPVIVGTNIIRTCKYNIIDQENNEIPEQWELAFEAIALNSLGVVRTTSKLTLKPMETKTITGFTRRLKNVDSAVTERSPQEYTPKISACPRVVRLSNPGKTSRVPVKLCNLSATTITLPAKSIVCELQEVKVVRSCEFGSTDKATANVSQRTTSTPMDELDKPSFGVDLHESDLSEQYCDRTGY